MPSASELASTISKRAKELRNNHISGLSETRTEPYVNLAYTSSVAAYRSVRDHVVNITEAMNEEN